VPLDPLQTIQQFEDSSGNPAQLNYEYGPQHTAAGLYQINTSTWNPIAAQNNLPQVGPGTPYANVGALPASVQTQGATALYNQQGFQPWVCGGCDAPLANYIQQQGGAGAFTLPGSYAPGSAVASSGGTGLATPATGSDYSGVSMSPINPASQQNATSGILGDTPFQTVYAALVTNMQTQVQGGISQVENIAYEPFAAILVLLVMVLGVGAMFGEVSVARLKSFVLRAIFVLAFIAPGSSWYVNYIVNGVTGFQNLVSTTISQDFVGGTPASGQPAAPFDSAWAQVNAYANRLYKETPWYDKPFLAFEATVVEVVALLGLVAIFLVFVGVQFLIGLALIVGPIFIVCLLSRIAEGYFRSWLDLTVGLLVVSMLTTLLVSYMMGEVKQVMGNLPAAGTPDADMGKLFSAVVVIALFGLTASSLPIVGLLMRSAIAPVFAVTQYFTRESFAAIGRTAGGRISTVRARLRPMTDRRSPY
jgi:uncharacterized membrane protein